MKRTFLGKVFALAMMAAFFFAIIPHDFIHGFTGHQDTRDVYHPFDNISHKHTHCAFLNIAISPYVEGHSPVLPLVPISLTTPVIPSSPTPLVIHAFEFRLRGPPAAML